MDPNAKSNTTEENKTEKAIQKYSKSKDLIIAILGIIIFVIIVSLLIYEGGNSLFKYYAKHNPNSIAASNGELDSISTGDADISSVVDGIGNRINNILGGKDEFDSKNKDSLVLLDQSTTTASSTLITKPDTQYVIISFDGSRSIPMWNETRQFAKDMASKGKPVHFTYFINPIYLITKDVAKKLYQPPTSKIGDSLIGYADSEQDVKSRVEQINLAYSEGNEIGSHNVGHFNGSKWSLDQWLQESNSFDSIIANVQKNNPDVVIQPWISGLTNVVGFRAPELGVNSDLYKALSEKKYLYDASGIRMPNKYPVKDKNGIWHIGLGIVKMKDLTSDGIASVGKPHYVLSMDYNFWMLQSRVKNIATKGTPLWNTYFAEMKDSYLNYFNNNYEGNRAPVVIGHHFSAWNDGVYWEALKSFAEDVCGKPNVKCVTFREYVDYLNSASKQDAK